MAILENATDYAVNGQVTPTNLNALTESSKFVKSTGSVASTGNTTDETTLDVDSSGQLIIKSLGVDTAQLAASAVETAKIAADAVTGAKIADDTIDSEHYAAGSIDAEHIATGAVTATKVGDGFINAQSSELSAAPADADELLISDSGSLKKIGIDNFMKHPAIPKAYGVVTWDTAALAAGSYNVQNPTDPTANRVNIEFINDMSTALYVVQLTWGAAAEETSFVTVYDRQVGDFTIYANTAKGSGRVIHFTVYGIPA